MANGCMILKQSCNVPLCLVHTEDSGFINSSSLSVIHTPTTMTATGGAETSDVRRGE